MADLAALEQAAATHGAEVLAELGIDSPEFLASLSDATCARLVGAVHLHLKQIHAKQHVQGLAQGTPRPKSDLSMTVHAPIRCVHDARGVACFAASMAVGALLFET